MKLSIRSLTFCSLTLCLAACSSVSPGLSGRGLDAALARPSVTTAPAAAPTAAPATSSTTTARTTSALAFEPLGPLTAQSGRAPAPAPPRRKLVWHLEQPLMQGFLGVSGYDEVKREGGSSADVDGDSGDLDELPLIGGGAQWKLGGTALDIGFEAMFSIEGRANAAAFATGGGGAIIAVDVDLLIVDIYGGPFVSKFLGDKLRAYGSIGPLMQFASYDQDLGASHDGGSGFGFGGYARAGLEWILSSGTMVGFGVRWSDSSIDLDGGMGELEIEGLQAMFTVTQGI